METTNNDQNTPGVDDQQHQAVPHHQEHSTQDVQANHEGNGENMEQRPDADSVPADESEKAVHGSEGGGGWNNDKPGATREDKDTKLIPIPDNENYTS